MAARGKTSDPKSDGKARDHASGDVQELLFRYTDRLYRAKTPDHVYNAALDAICDGLGSDRASILRFNDAGVMRFVAWRGLSRRYRADVEGHCPWKPDERAAKPICVEDIARSKESDAIKTAVQAENIRGLAFIPLTIGGGVVGKFMVYYSTPRLFSEQELDLALIIARQLGFAIERLYDDGIAQQLAAIVDSSQDAIISCGLDGVIASWNDGAERLYGYSKAEAIGRSLAMLVPPGQDNEAPELLSRIRRGERVKSYETVRRCKDGRIVDVSLTASPIRGADGRVIGASKIARDISARREGAERQALLLREMNHRIKNLFTISVSLLRLSAGSASSPKELADIVSDRLQALARAHTLTIAPNAQGDCIGPSETHLFALLEAILSPFDVACRLGEEKAQISITGDNLEMEPEAATPLALLVYELATNATKYGSLSTPGGRVEIRIGKNGKQPVLTWREVGGPPTGEPGTNGFGSTLIDLSASQLGAVERNWRASGLEMRVTICRGVKSG
ncbi:MAG: PAS domain S-box protein [Sphingobium sp.]|nr:PAS domain S-box protein [Sphingobium sp.]